NGGKNSLNRLIRCVCGKKIGPDPRNFNQRVSLGRNDLLIRTFLSIILIMKYVSWFVACNWSLLKPIWRGLLMLVFSG
ncbi:hypothetical protein, partial [Escherichia coli]|uniref:hypothetical protein n=1 Tax=Escherichia coli TaxID=562 RepID=UPI001BFE67C9